jgi:hypothetical protein
VDDVDVPRRIRRNRERFFDHVSSASLVRPKFMDPNRQVSSTPTRHPVPPKTRLQQYLDEHSIPSARVEKEAQVSRQHMARWRHGTSGIRLRKMIDILRALRTITGVRVTMEEVFVIEPDDWPT